jgi:methylenetetrahydrofolate reductase (NADPH)
LERVLRSGRFAVTCELSAVDSADPSAVHDLADRLRGKVDGVNCTDNSAAHPHLSSVAAGHLLSDRGVEPIVQFACRDRNRLALQADMLGAAALGVRNIVCMTGDDVSAGDHPEASPIYDVDAMHALRIAHVLREEGTYLSGRPLSGPPDFFIGAVENPFAPPVEFRPHRLAKKVEAGAEFIQTQICFNVPRLREFMTAVRDLGLLDRVFILAGVFIARSASSLHYLRDQVPGVDVPPDVVARMDGVPKARQEEESLAITKEIVEQVREIPGIAGVHLMTIAWEEAILRLIEKAALSPAERGVTGDGISV